MTTNKPKVFRFHCHGYNAPAYSCNRPYDNSGEYVRLSDYKTLQAEYEKLRKDAERYRWLRLQVGVQLTGSQIYPASPYLLVSPPAREFIAEYRFCHRRRNCCKQGG